MKFLANYYYQDLEKFFSKIIPSKSSFLKINPQTDTKKINHKYDYFLLVNSLAYNLDIQKYVKDLKKQSQEGGRVVVIYYNFFWKPILDLASLIGLRKKEVHEPNWLSPEDIDNFFKLEGFELVFQGKRFLFPLNLGIISDFINNFLAQLPIVNFFCLTTYQIFRIRPQKNEYSVSIIIPARNEAGHMKNVLNKIPTLGKSTEIIFVEGNSKDNTYQVIESEIKKYKGKLKVQLLKQIGKGKGDAVRLGFEKAQNEILMILDADLTVPPSDLIKFYDALANGYGEFINGSRLVYPMEKDAMRSLNYLANKIFSIIFSYLLGQKVKDTLCGTKVLFKKDYLKIKENRKTFGDFDPFGDFDLLFGAANLNLKITEVAVRYRERVYGTTNISRFRHGLLLLEMTIFAARKIKFR